MLSFILHFEFLILNWSEAIDHYIPLSRGGSNKIKNLRLACHSCNNTRGNALPEGVHYVPLPHAIEDMKSEALQKFIAELMDELIRQGFTFSVVLEAIATWSESQKPDEVTRRLEELVKAIKEIG